MFGVLHMCNDHSKIFFFFFSPKWAHSTERNISKALVCLSLHVKSREEVCSQRASMPNPWAAYLVVWSVACEVLSQSVAKPFKMLLDKYTITPPRTLIQLWKCLLDQWIYESGKMFSDALWIPQLETILLENTQSGLWGAVSMSLRSYMIDMYFLATFPPFFHNALFILFVHIRILLFLFHTFSSSVAACH